MLRAKAQQKDAGAAPNAASMQFVPIIQTVEMKIIYTIANARLGMKEMESFAREV